MTNLPQETEPIQKLLATALLSAFALVQAPVFAQDKKAEPAKAEAKKDEQKKPKKGGC